MKEEMKNLTRKNWGSSFIISYNDFFNYENDSLFLNIDQFYTYATLCSLIRLNGSIVTSLSVIEECLPVPYSSNSNYNRRKIKESLIVLAEKGIIETNKENIGSLRLNESIIIYINDEFIQENQNIKGFEQISLSDFYKIDSPTDFYLRCCIIRYDINPLNPKKKEQYTQGFGCSYEKWSKILECTERYAIQTLNDAIEREVVYLNIGDYISDKKQSINTYRIRPFKESEKTTATRLREQERKELEQDKRHAFGKKKSK